MNPPNREVTSLINSLRTKMEVVTVTCILCNGTVNFKNRDPALFNAHMRDQHNTFYRIDYILASCFMQGQHLDKVEEEWAKMEREQRVEEVVEVDQNGEETNNGLNFEMLEEEEVGVGRTTTRCKRRSSLTRRRRLSWRRRRRRGRRENRWKCQTLPKGGNMETETSSVANASTPTVPRAT